MEARTFGAISLGSAGNMQGTYLFLSLTSWKIIRRRSWVEVPMPAEVIQLINSQALKSTTISLESEIKIGGIILDDDNVDEYEPYVPAQRVVKLRDGLMAEIFGDDEPDQESEIIKDNIVDVQNLHQGTGSYESNIQPSEHEPMEILDEIFEPDEYQQEIIKMDNNFRSEDNMDITHRYDLRTVRSDWRKKYPSGYTASVILSNLSIPKAIRLYGVEAVASIMKEMHQLQDKGVWTPIKYENIEDKSKIIRSLLFLKRKRDGTLKARLVADGRMQDRSTSQDNSSPTVGTESLFLMSAIFAAENRHVVTATSKEHSCMES